MDQNTRIQIRENLLQGLSLAAMTAILIGGSACEPVPAIAPREQIVPIQQRVHTSENETLYNNKFFLWPVETSGETIKNVLEVSKEIDRLDKLGFDKSREVEALRARVKPIQDAEAQVSTLQRQARQLPAQIRAKEGAVSRSQAAVDSTQAAITALQAQIADESARDPNSPNLPGLQSDLALKQGELQTRQNTLTNDQGALALLRQQLADNPGLLATAQGEVSRLVTEIDPDGTARRRLNDELPGEQAQVKDQGDQQVARITNLVYWYKNQPSRVSLRFVEGRPSVVINEWALFAEGEEQADKRDYSTEAGTITNVSYQSKGGVWRFDLGVFEDSASDLTAGQKAAAIQEAVQGRWNGSLKEVYSFRFGRTSYDKTEDPNDGRKFYGGEMNRLRDPQGPYCTGIELSKLGCKRQGSVKLVDRNN